MSLTKIPTSLIEGLNKAAVGLGSVDNTADASKPVSTAQQTALDLKANLASPTFTGTVAGINKSMVGLGNVDNTSDINKPISTAVQAALDAVESGGSGVSQDAYYPSVVLLISGDNVLTDESPTPKTASTLTGLTSVQTGTYFGTGALNNASAVGPLAEFAASSDFDITGDYTLEFWITPAAGIVAGSYLIATSGVRYFNYQSDGSTGTLTHNGWGNSSSIAVAPGERAHIVFSKVGTTVRTFKNDVLGTSEVGTAPDATVTVPLALFGVPTRDDLAAFKGKLEEIRWTKGVGRFNASSTDVLQTEVYPRVRLTADPYKANLASPTFTGVPAAPTATVGTNTTQLATTAFVATGLALKANLASPTLTGTPLAPTAAAATNNTQIATTSYVTTAVSTAKTTLELNAQTGTSYVLVLADAGKRISMTNAAANELTIPNNSTVAFPVNTVIYVTQEGVGATTIATSVGVGTTTADGSKVGGQYRMITLIKTATNTWLLIGAVS